MARGHYIEGVLAGELTYPIMPFPHLTGTAGVAELAGYVVLVALAALFPDIDHPKSRITTSLGPVTGLASWLVIRLAKAVYQLSRGPADYPSADGHREITHTPVSGPVVAAAVWLAVPGAWALPVAGGVLVGWLTHIAGDACSNSGVPALWPIKIRGRRWGHYGIPRWMRFKTGGHGAAGGWQAHGEHVVTFLALVGCVVVGVLYVDPHLLTTITQAM